MQKAYSLSKNDLSKKIIVKKIYITLYKSPLIIKLNVKLCDKSRESIKWHFIISIRNISLGYINWYQEAIFTRYLSSNSQIQRVWKPNRKCISYRDYCKGFPPYCVPLNFLLSTEPMFWIGKKLLTCEIEQASW